MSNSAQLINQTSGKTEYYTPPAIIKAARLCMGGISLDPASSDIANNRVRADVFYDEKDDGLSLSWNGNIWLNHPFSRKGNPMWISKLLNEVLLGNAAQACCITYACTSEAWFRPLLTKPQCFLIPRTNYLLPDGTVYRGVTKGSVVTYFGRDNKTFADAFSALGVVKIPWK